MDGLDKVGDESSIQKSNKRQTTHSEENLFAGKLLDERQKMNKDSNDNLNISDEETPPPLFPRKRREPRREDMYDTLVVPPSLAYRIKAFPNSTANTNNTVQTTSSTTSDNAENGQKREGKHRYANLDGEISLSQEQNPVLSRPGAHEDDPYDVLVSPSRNGDLDGNMKTLDTLNKAGDEAANTGLTTTQPDVSNAYDTLVLRNSPLTDTNTARLHIQDGSTGDVSPESQDQTNGIHSLYEHQVPRRLTRGSTLNTARGTVASVVSDIEKSRERPALPPKLFKMNDTLSSGQSATLPSSKRVAQSTQKYSPPVAPRIKKPPRTVPKPSDDNVD
jgi:hypothetical protein